MINRKKAIGIIGSYRKGGILDSAVTEVLAEAERQGAQTRKIYLLDCHIEFCTNCRSCMQSPGPDRGRCIIDDDMNSLLDEIENADCLVIGAPVNVGNVNALTRRFMERCVGYGYWPWGAAAPKGRVKGLSKKSVLVSSSAAPFIIGRYLTGAYGALKKLSEILGAKPVGLLWVGLVNKQQMELPEKAKKKARKLGRKLAS